MPMRRPAAEIDPVSAIASKSAALPGPIAIAGPSRMRSRGSRRSAAADPRLAPARPLTAACPSLGLEGHGRAVHAIALPPRLPPVGTHMTQMAPALLASNFGANH